VCSLEFRPASSSYPRLTWFNLGKTKRKIKTNQLVRCNEIFVSNSFSVYTRAPIQKLSFSFTNHFTFICFKANPFRENKTWNPEESFLAFPLVFRRCLWFGLCRLLYDLTYLSAQAQVLYTEYLLKLKLKSSTRSRCFSVAE